MGGEGYTRVPKKQFWGHTCKDSENPWVATDAIKTQIFGTFSPETALWLSHEENSEGSFKSLIHWTGNLAYETDTYTLQVWPRSACLSCLLNHSLNHFARDSPLALDSTNQSYFPLTFSCIKLYSSKNIRVELWLDLSIDSLLLYGFSRYFRMCPRK